MISYVLGGGIIKQLILHYLVGSKHILFLTFKPLTHDQNYILLSDLHSKELHHAEIIRRRSRSLQAF